MNDALSEYGRTIEEIAAGLAHDIKNPLAFVRASLELLEQNDNGRTNSGSYSAMRRELDRINELVIDFLQIARPVTKTVPFDLYDMIFEVIEIAKAAYYVKENIKFEIDQVSGGFIINGDPGKLRRVFVNIIKNAAEAIDDGIDSGIIKINIQEKNRKIVIKITDNGHGISNEDLARIDAGHYSTKPDGNGIGLYITKAIIHEHGGTLALAGNEGGGCTVTVTLFK